MEQVKVHIKRIGIGKNMDLPRYMTPGSAGMDLYAAVDETRILNPGEIQLVPTGISIALPEGYEAQIRPRSGLALKHGVTMVNTPGTIDSDYRGEIAVIMINLGKQPFEIHKGDRIAQMVINKVARAQWLEVDSLDETIRSSGGFGSTGK